MSIRKVYLLLVAFVISTSVVAQSPVNQKKLLKKARKQLSEAAYPEAKESYNKLIEADPSNCEYYFEGGLAYFNSEVEKEKSVGYFEKALSNSKKDTIAEVLFYLAKSYHYTHQFDKAIYFYNAFRDFILSSDEGHLLGSEMTQYIEMCNNGIALQKTTNTDVIIKNLGNRVNTVYAEYAPVPTQDESKLIYTSRQRGVTGEAYFYDNKYFEDIYVAVKEDTNWTIPTKFDSLGIYVSSKINTKTHDAAIGYNADETKLFIYRDKDVWQSELIDGKWSEPVRMNKSVNTKGHEASVFLTPDEKILYFVSTRGDGFGGRDIWISKKLEDGTWGPAENLGEYINTPEDEDAPYLSKDGKTFYFSSRGHNTIGGYDVFKCELNDEGKWSDPINLGMPINSAGDDIYYLVNSDNTVGYYSSSRMNGYGDMDIYRIQLDCRSIPNTEVRGLLLAGDKQLPVGGAITITDKESGEIVGTYKVDKTSGKYLMVLPPKKTYILDLVAEGFEASRPHREEFTIPKQCETFQLFQEINIRRFKDTTKNQIAQEALFQNGMFDIQSKAIEEFNIQGLPEDGSFTKQEVNPDLTLSLSGTIFNSIQPVPQTTVYLVNQKNEIIRTTKTNESGTFQFLHLNPKETYSLLISETDAGIAIHGNDFDGTQLILVNGKVEQTTLINGTTIPAVNVPIKIVNSNKKIVNLTKTDLAGNYLFINNASKTAEIAQLNLETNYTYNIDLGDADALYSSLLKTLDPNNNDLNYTEYIDLIYLEKLIRELPKFENIYFDFDKFFLRPKSIEVLDLIAKYLTENTDVLIDIAGHCDWKGTDEYNIKLSERRSMAAFNYLVTKGIDPKRMKSNWFGENRPAANNENTDGTDNPEGRQLNRRCEFRVNVPDMGNVTFLY